LVTSALRIDIWEELCTIYLSFPFKLSFIFNSEDA
jgi:hypothetical protein